ncbi:Flavodoxin-like fold [Chryseobacterium arachidis]|uniref:Flavodoxin-like fold n=1 Tax=Chryseobacterium arachidis TaxID=1416778 RepID=A0A1M5I941_9FLAO|nr:NAD(P)H-dependent oxidoreductase [Chryseobacterium arachidis]SHG24762.1 Flavodoxin-like fold [Chryseobacterium arachidis]
MKQILHIMSSPKEDSSASRKMEKKLVQQLLEKYADGTVVEYDLSRMEIPHLAENHINAFFKPADQRTEKDGQDIIFSDKAGVYSEGKLKDYDFVTNYVQFFLELIGIEVIAVFRAEGQAIFGREESLNIGLQSIVLNV